MVSANVSDEVDFGLGLLKFLPIDRPQTWADAVVELAGRRGPTDPDAWSERVRAAGGDIQGSVDLLHELYGLGPR